MKPTNNTVQKSTLDPELLSAVDDIHQRFNDGERVSIDDYVKRFPQHEATLRQVFQTFQFMTAYGDSVVGVSPTSSKPQEHRKQIGEFTILARSVGVAWASFTKPIRALWSVGSLSRSCRCWTSRSSTDRTV